MNCLSICRYYFWCDNLIVKKSSIRFICLHQHNLLSPALWQFEFVMHIFSLAHYFHTLFMMSHKCWLMNSHRLCPKCISSSCEVSEWILSVLLFYYLSPRTCWVILSSHPPSVIVCWGREIGDLSLVGIKHDAAVILKRKMKNFLILHTIISVSKTVESFKSIEKKWSSFLPF